MSEFVETNDGRLINVAHIVTAEWRNGEWRLRLSDGRDAYYHGESFRAMKLNDAVDSLIMSNRKANITSEMCGPAPEKSVLSQITGIQQETAMPSD